MKKPEFTDHPIVTKDRDSYADIIVDVAAAIESYRMSLMSFEVLDREGNIKADDQVDVAEQATRQGIREIIEKGQAVEKPIVGLGMHDNFEIGVGRSIFTTLALDGVLQIPVHVRKGQLEYLKEFIVQDAKSA